MTFGDALAVLQSGGSVKRAAWKRLTRMTLGRGSTPQFVFATADRRTERYSNLSIYDILASDWIEVTSAEAS